MTDSPDEDTRSMRERMLAGDLYRGADEELVAEMEQAMRLTKRYNDSDPGDGEGRRAILEELLGEVGEDVDIRPPLQCDYGSHIRVGARTFVNFGLMALDVAPITIGADVLMGPNVQLLTPTHPLEPVARREKWEAALPITIGDNVWIGGLAVICPGQHRRGRRGRRRRGGHQGRAGGCRGRRQPRARRPVCLRRLRRRPAAIFNAC